MEYLNIIIFILIFIILLVVFYLIISNLGVVSSNSNQDIEKKVNGLKYELSNLKNKLGITSSETSNLKNKKDVHEILIDSTIPIVNIKDFNNSDVDEQTIKLTNSSYPDNVNTKNTPIIYDPIANYDIAKLTDPLVDPRGRTSADQIPTPQVAAQFNFPTQGVLDRYHRVGLLIAIGSNAEKENIGKINKFGLPYVESDSSDETCSELVWESNNKMGKSKSKKSKYRNSNSSENTSSKSYKGVEIKENFESDSDTDSMEYFGNTDNNNVTNIYNVYSNQNDNNILELIGKKITDNWYKYFTSITMGNKIIKVVVRNRNRKELYSGDIVFIPEIGKTYRVKIDPMDMIEYNPYMF
jgi:hypothetical protein